MPAQSQGLRQSGAALRPVHPNHNPELQERQPAWHMNSTLQTTCTWRGSTAQQMLEADECFRLQGPAP